MSTVLDVCCGSRSFYFDKDDQRVHFNDIRREDVQLCDGRTISINPDTTWDFTNLPCPDESFSLVVFDPPHLLHAGDTSWLKAKYGVLPPAWESYIKKGFEECLRVLKPSGALVMKWSSVQISAQQVLKAIGAKPLLGTKRAKSTYWWIFVKGGI